MRISRRRPSICGNHPILDMDAQDYEMVGHEVLWISTTWKTIHPEIRQ